MTSASQQYLPQFTDAAVLEAEGARVGIVTCLTCGSAVLVDRRDEVDAVERHKEWHRSATTANSDRSAT